MVFSVRMLIISCAVNINIMYFLSYISSVSLRYRHFTLLYFQARLAATPNKNSSRTYITSPQVSLDFVYVCVCERERNINGCFCWKRKRLREGDDIENSSIYSPLPCLRARALTWTTRSSGHRRQSSSTPTPTSPTTTMLTGRLRLWELKAGKSSISGYQADA